MSKEFSNNLLFPFVAAGKISRATRGNQTGRFSHGENGIFPSKVRFNLSEPRNPVQTNDGVAGQGRIIPRKMSSYANSPQHAKNGAIA
jgi:hypothetical protein